MGWVRVLLPGDVPQAVAIGRSGVPPAAQASDVADFLVAIPYPFTAMELRATMLVAPSAPTRLQIRRSTDGGNTWADAFGFVDVGAGSRQGTNEPPAYAFNEGDLINFSVVSGGGSGENLTVIMMGRRT